MKLKILLVTALSLGFLLFQVGFRVSSNGVRLARNFHEVDPGKLYRSAQLSEDELKDVIAQYGIKTIINLQGKRPGQEWYETEQKVTQEFNVQMVNVEMAVASIPKRFEFLKLLEAYKNAERPILVHCRAGSDRTGEAVAIYQMEYMGKPKTEANESFSFKYMYIELFAPSKTYFVEKYLGKDWAYYEYSHCDSDWQYADQRECPQL